MAARQMLMVALAAAAIALAGQGARADAKADAEKHFKVGVALLEAEDWAAAASEFELSVQLFPTKMGLFNLANAYRALHRYQEALDTVDRIDREFAQKLDPEFKDAMAELWREIRGMVGRLRVNVEQSGAEIAVDGRVMGKSPLDPFVLAPGEHRVRVSRDGYAPQEHSVRISVGETTREKFDLQRDKAAIPTPTPVPAPALTPAAAPAQPAASLPIKTPAPVPTPAPAQPAAGGPVEKPAQPVVPAPAAQPNPPVSDVGADAKAPKTCNRDKDCQVGFVCSESSCKPDEPAQPVSRPSVPKPAPKPIAHVGIGAHVVPPAITAVDMTETQSTGQDGRSIEPEGKGKHPYAFFWTSFSLTLVCSAFTIGFGAAGNERNDDYEAMREEYLEWVAAPPSAESVAKEAKIYPQMKEAKDDADQYRNATIGFGVATGAFAALATIGLIVGAVKSKGEGEVVDEAQGEPADDTLIEVSAAPGGLAVSF